MPESGTRITLRAADGHALSAYRSAPASVPVGGLVVLQEIFGVNAHMREICDAYAGRGFLTIAPALFDRARRGTELGYDEQAVARGRALRTAIAVEATLLDVQAAIDAAAEGGGVAVLGYCWGGSIAFMSATRLSGVRCAVAYYGAQTIPYAHEPIRVPVLMHFGEHDPRIPPADIATIMRHNPGIEMHLYPADHGFNCDHREEWHAESASRALARTLVFLERNLPRATVSRSDPDSPQERTRRAP